MSWESGAKDKMSKTHREPTWEMLHLKAKWQWKIQRGSDGGSLKAETSEQPEDSAVGWRQGQAKGLPQPSQKAGRMTKNREPNPLGTVRPWGGRRQEKPNQQDWGGPKKIKFKPPLEDVQKVEGKLGPDCTATSIRKRYIPSASKAAMPKQDRK